MRTITRPRVALYKRVSTEEQVQSGYSLEAQETACRRHLDRLYGVDGYTVEVFADEGISGRYGYKPGQTGRRLRPALAALVAAVKAGEIDVVAFWRLDRLGRNARVWLDFVHECVDECDVALVSVSDNIDPTTPMGRFAASFMALAAELFSNIGAENVKSGMRQRREDGYPTGRVGYGWRNTGPVGDRNDTK